jgi:sigma-B regulation protein RsbU (phosphoserine phosphatase)
MGQPDRSPPLDRHRLDRILQPWALQPDGPDVSVVDARGVTLAGRTATTDPADERSRISAEVTVDGVVLARIVATGRTIGEPGVEAGIASLAIAVGELMEEARLRAAADRALEDGWAEATAAAHGIDAAELAKGRRQQRSILSLLPPDVAGYDLASHYAAARQIGGDFFELFMLGGRAKRLGIAVADVTGKGLDAALLMAFTRPVLHSALNAAKRPADALRRTNRVLVGEHRGTLFITAISAVLTPGTGRIRIANAGHEPPWLIPADGGAIRPVGDAGVLLGAFDEVEPPEVTVVLAPGDRLLFYTDGATDAVDPAGERFGEARLLATITSARDGSARDLVDAARDAVTSFQGSAEPADDLTLVAIGRQWKAARRPGGHEPPGAVARGRGA